MFVSFIRGIDVREAPDCLTPAPSLPSGPAPAPGKGSYRATVVGNAIAGRTFGRGEPVVFALFPVAVARGLVAVAWDG